MRDPDETTRLLPASSVLPPPESDAESDVYDDSLRRSSSHSTAYHEELPSIEGQSSRLTILLVVPISLLGIRN